MAEVPPKGRNTMGVSFATPRKGDAIVAVARNVDRGVAAEVEDDAVASDPGPASEDGSEPATDATTDSGDQAPGGDQ